MVSTEGVPCATLCVASLLPYWPNEFEEAVEGCHMALFPGLETRVAFLQYGSTS